MSEKKKNQGQLARFFFLVLFPIHVYMMFIRIPLTISDMINNNWGGWYGSFKTNDIKSH
jgi:hypothetical protein